MFNLTRQERQVILFLASLALLGLGVDFLNKINSQNEFLFRLNEGIGKINLNSADKETLMTVKGVGEKLAGRIIGYRAEHAGFNDIEELKSIKGINNSVYEKIKDSFLLK